LFPLLGAAVVCLAVRATAADAPAPVVEHLSARPELMLAHSQAWGDLGWDLAAHENHKPGAPLRIGSRPCTNGLGHHAAGRLVILLGGEFERFDAEVGLQPCPGGSVVFRVSADDRLLFDSGVMRSGDEARSVSVPVAGAQELVLEAQDAGDGITCDMANWANARLTRAPGARAPATGEAVDVAPFASVVTSDPNRLDGSKADRLQEYRAEDVFLEAALSASPDGTYTLLPATNGVACIGLNWFSRRPLRELRLRLADREPMPAADAVKVQGWFGESLWQGRWLPLDGVMAAEKTELVLRLSSRAPRGGLLQTRKIRWLLPVAGTSLTVRESRAYTRARWAEASVRVEAEKPAPGARGQVRVFNGELLTRDGVPAPSATGWNDWELARPLQLTLRYARPSSLKGDATVLQFHLPAGGVGAGLEDLLASNSIYVPSRGLFVTVATNPGAAPTLAEYTRRIAGRKTVLDEVRALPDQTLAQAMAKTHRAAQNEGPVMLSLACDNTKYVVGRGGDISFPVAPVKGEDWFAAAGDLRPVLGDGQRDRASRRLEGGWLPIPVITFEREGVRCTERVFVAPADDDGPDPTRLNRRAVGVAEFTLENLREQPASARLELLFRRAGNPKPAAELLRESETRFGARLGLTRAMVTLDENGSLTGRAEGGRLTLAGTLPPGGRGRAVVFLGGEELDALRPADVPRLRAAVERHWRAVLADATQIDTPDELLNNVLRSSRVRCLIAARNEAGGARVAPWIAAMAYGPLESEAHSVLRGLDFLGHHDFARRGLEFFIHRYNTNGFLTTGYTTFGTAWHLWTLGEHCALTADRDWLRRQAPELRRVGDWILRQLEKTRRGAGGSPAPRGREAPGTAPTGPLAPDGQPVPEFGLMPPAVMADWNAFACHFMLNGYYHAALRELGAALAGLGDPRAADYTRGAEELRGNIRRAYRWTQARAPALPLRDGTWIPLYPSQVHSPGKLEHFFPGDDAGRSWAYDTELGAHQLAPTGVFAPDDPEVTRMLNHLEDVQFLGEGWFDYPAAANAQDWFNLGGFAKVQPYYGRNAEVYALRDDVKPFVRSYFNSLASLLNTEVLTLWEHFRHSGAWDKTHETGYFLHQTRTMLVQERGQDLWLAPLLPADWLRPGQSLLVSNAPTRFGPVSYRITARPDAPVTEVQLTPPSRATPARVVVRLRAPEGRVIRSVRVDGRPHDDFDPAQSTVTLKPGDRPTSLAVRHE
jgi:hypothetical protein